MTIKTLGILSNICLWTGSACVIGALGFYAWVVMTGDPTVKVVEIKYEFVLDSVEHIRATSGWVHDTTKLTTERGAIIHVPGKRGTPPLGMRVRLMTDYTWLVYDEENETWVPWG